ncbi:MAG: tRNA 2-thiocytidine(32) synthetase TtcA [Deltaproteobacteria bacterium]|nr:tRNA 2-thiocytidine(32) synthetase TtcA [Deltaproteobacteria bacterium]
MNKRRKKLRRLTGRAIQDFEMLVPGDRIMVCLSGGKDSYSLLDLLLSFKETGEYDCEIIAVNLDQKQPDYPEEVLPAYLESLGIEYHILEKDTYSLVKKHIKEGQTMCSLCSRLRRGNLYSFAREIGATKIALGHHREDIIETLFLNMFFGGTLKAMAPKLKSDDGQFMLIRPLAYCKEKDIARYAEDRAFPIIPCNLCGSQENLQRQTIKKMLSDWDKEFPGRSENIFRAMQNTVPSHLADHKLFDFKGLGISEDDLNDDTPSSLQETGILKVLQG